MGEERDETEQEIDSCMYRLIRGEMNLALPNSGPISGINLAISVSQLWEPPHACLIHIVVVGVEDFIS